MTKTRKPSIPTPFRTFPSTIGRVPKTAKRAHAAGKVRLQALAVAVLFFATLLANIPFVAAAFATIPDTGIGADVLTADVPTKYYFNFTLAPTGAWPTQGKFVVDFPVEFGLNNLPTTGTCTLVNAPTGITCANVGVSSSANRLIIARTDTGPPIPGGTTIQLTVPVVGATGIRNPPPGEYVRAAFKAETQTSMGQSIESGTLRPSTALANGVLKIVGKLEQGSAAALYPKPGAETSYIFSFRTTHPWSASGRLQIEFPSQFSLPTTLAVGPGSMVSGCTSLGALSVSIVDVERNVTLTRPGSPGASDCAADTVVTIQLDNVANPAAGLTGAFNFTTFNTGTTAVVADRGTAPGVWLSTPLQSFQVSALTGTPRTGEESTYRLSFTTPASVANQPAWGPNGFLLISLPSGFDASHATLEGTSAGCLGPGNLFLLEKTAQTITLAGADNCAPNTPLSVDLGRITNPATTGSLCSSSCGAPKYGTSTALTTLNSAGAFVNILEPADPTTSVNILRHGSLDRWGAATPMVVPLDTTAGAVTAYTLHFTPTTPWPADGQLVIKLPPVSGIGPFAFGALSVTAAGCVGDYTSQVFGLTAIITRSGSSQVCTGNLALTVQGIQNAGSSATFGPLSLLTRRANGVELDYAETSVTLTPGALPNAEVRRNNNFVGRPADHSFVFDSANPWPSGGKIEIDLPSEYGIPTLGSTPEFPACAPHTTLVADLIARTLSMTRTGAPCEPGSKALLVSLTNPATSGRSGTFTFTLKDGDGNIIARNLAVAGIDSAPEGDLTDLSITAQNPVAGARTTYTVSFTTPSKFLKNEKVVVDFPSPYGAENNLATAGSATGSCTSASGPASFTTTITVSGRRVTAARTGQGPDCEVGTVTLVLPEIVNAPVSGPTAAFAVFTRTNGGTDKEGTMGFPGPILDPAILEVTQAISADSLVAGALTTEYVFSVKLANPWPDGGKARITFPSGYDVSQVTGAQVTAACSGSLLAEPISDQRAVLLTRQPGAQVCPKEAAIKIEVAGVENPGRSGQTAAFQVETLDSTETPIDVAHDVAGVVIQRTGAPLSAVGIQRSSTSAGDSSVYTFSFATTNTWSANGRVELRFPAGFVVTGAALQDVTGPNLPADGTFELIVSEPSAYIVRLGGTPWTGGAKEIQLAGIQNPPISGATSPFRLALQDSSGIDIDTSDAGDPALPVTITPGHLQAFPPSPQSPVVGETTAYAFTFTPTNVWPPSGKLGISFPEGYGIGNAAFESIETCDGALIASANPTIRLLTLSRTGAGHTQCSGAITVHVGNILNPAASAPSGTFSIRTMNNALVPIDERTLIPPPTLLGATTMADTSIVPTSLVTGTSTNYRFQFKTTNDWPSNGRFVVTLPHGYGVGSVTQGAAGSGAGVSGSFTAQPQAATATTPAKVIVTRSGSATTWAADATNPKSITIFGIGNPAVSGATGSFYLSTQTASGTDLDASDAIPGPTLDPAPLTNTQVSGTPLGAGQTAAYTFKFKPTNAWLPDGKLVITFPPGYNTDAAAFSSSGSQICQGTLLRGQGEANELVFSRATGSTTPQTCLDDITVPVSGIRNPTQSGPTGSFQFRTTDSAMRTVDASDLVPGVPIGAAGTLTGVSLAPDNLEAGEVTNYRLGFKTQITWPANGQFLVTFPTRYTLGAVAVQAHGVGVSGSFSAQVQPASGSTGPRVLVTRGGESAAAWPGGSEEKTLVLLGIQNPGRSGPTGVFSFVTRDASGSDLAAASLADPFVLTPGQIESLPPSVNTLAAGAAAQYTFTFETSNPWPADGRLRIEFPSTFGISSVASTAAAAGSGVTGTFTATHNGQTVTVTRGGSGAQQWLAGEKTITVGPIRNPAFAGASGPFSIALLDGTGRIIDENTAVPGITIKPAALVNPSVAATNPMVGQVSDYSFSFTTLNPIPANGKVVVKFPPSYPSSSITTPTTITCRLNGATVVRSADVSTEFTSEVLGATVILPSGEGCDPGSATFALRGINNAGRSGPAKGFTLETRSSDGTPIERANNVAGVVLAPTGGPLTGVVVTKPAEDPAPTSGARTSVTFRFTTPNAWPGDGSFVAEFPSGYVLTGGLTGPTITAPSGVTLGTINMDVEGQVVTVTRTGGTSWPAGEKTITIGNVKNPNVAGSTAPFYLATFSSSGNDIDASYAPTTIIEPAPFLAPQVSAADRAAGAITAYTFTFTTRNPWPADGRFLVAFPPGYSFGSVTAASTGACQGEFTANPVAASGSTPAQVAVVRSGLTECAAQDMVIVLGGIRNPSALGATGEFSGKTRTGAGQNIDAGQFPAVTIVSPAPEPDNIPPGLVGAFSSTDFPATPAWSKTKTGTITWGPATDTGGSTILKYASALDASPSVVLADAKSDRSASLAGLTDGSHSLNARAIDAAGNPGEASSYSFQVDTAPPSPAIVSSTTHAAGTCVAATSGSFTWSGGADSPSGLRSPNPYTYSLDSGIATATAQTSATLTGLKDGAHTLVVTTFDQAGNTATDSYAFKVDTDPPVVTVTGPQAAREAFTVKWNATDACSTVANPIVEVRKEGAAAWSAFASGAAREALFTPAAGDGIYEFQGRATDGLGHQGAFPSTPQLSVRVDTVPPPMVTNLQATSSSTGTIDLSWSAATDAASGIAGYDVYRSTQPTGPFDKITSAPVLTTTYRDTPTTIDEGATLYYQSRAVDKAGNTGPEPEPVPAVIVRGASVVVATASARTQLAAALGLSLPLAPSAADTNGDGRPDRFTDPNGQVQLSRISSIGQKAAFLLSNGEGRPTAIWIPSTNQVHELQPRDAQLVKTTQDGGETIVQIQTTKETGWIEVSIADPYPGLTISRVTTASGRTIPSEQVSRVDGKILFLDDPDAVYELTFGPTAGTLQVAESGPGLQWLWILGAVAAVLAVAGGGIVVARRRTRTQDESPADAAQSQPDSATEPSPTEPLPAPAPEAPTLATAPVDVPPDPPGTDPRRERIHTLMRQLADLQGRLGPAAEPETASDEPESAPRVAVVRKSGPHSRAHVRKPTPVRPKPAARRAPITKRALSRPTAKSRRNPRK